MRICLLSLAKLGMRMSKVRCEIIYMGLHNTWKPTACVCTDGISQKVSAEIVQSRTTSRSAFCVKQCCRCKGTGCVNCPLPFYLLASCPALLNARTLGEPFARGHLAHHQRCVALVFLWRPHFRSAPPRPRALLPFLTLCKTAKGQGKVRAFFRIHSCMYRALPRF